MLSDKPAWLEPDMHQRAIHQLRAGDSSVSEQWIKLVTARFFVIAEAHMDQARAAIRDLHALQDGEDPRARDGSLGTGHGDMPLDA